MLFLPRALPRLCRGTGGKGPWNIYNLHNIHIYIYIYLYTDKTACYFSHGSFQAEISMPAACPLTQVGHHSKQRPQDAQLTDHFASRPQAGTKHSSPRSVELVATVAVILLDHRCLQASNHAISTLDLEVQPSCIIVPVSRVYNSLDIHRNLWIYGHTEIKSQSGWAVWLSHWAGLGCLAVWLG